MIFKQFFEKETCTFTYLLADIETSEAIIIDSVVEETEVYLSFLKAHNLKLKYSIDTHVHADHVTAHSTLRDKTGCQVLMSKESCVKNADNLFKDGDIITCGKINLKAIHTPGHTNDSYCFLVNHLLFTGDTLMINATGRTDFQNGDAKAQYKSIFSTLKSLPEDIVIYPGHDYNGQTSSNLKEEFAHSPRLQVNSEQEYEKMMNNLNLDKPHRIEVSVPLNLNCGKSEELKEKA